MNYWDRYGNWLVRKVGFVKKDYSKLLKTLHNTEFYWLPSMDRDRNRAEDGIELRNEYLSERLSDGSLRSADPFHRECSVLEMLVALAIRVEDEFIGVPGDEHPDRFFFEMIKNLGLDDAMDYDYDQGRVEGCLSMWMGRRFSSRGLGSPFPVCNDRRDQRDFEIWDQMNHYIYEVYLHGRR